MRRLLISFVLPSLFCLVPIAAAGLVAVCIPRVAMERIWDNIVSGKGSIDIFILSLGTLLFVAQMIFAWRALRWRGTGFDHGVDRWVNHLGQAAEWFPMLGLIGTVGAILETFASIKGTTSPHEITQLFAPAITATGAGLFMAFVNILPPWMVIFGRDIILSLGGRRTANTEETAP